MANSSKPMTLHIPTELKDRVRNIAERRDRSLTKQIIAMLKAQAEIEDAADATKAEA